MEMSLFNLRECADGHRSEAWSVCEKIFKEKPEHTRDTWLELLEGKIDEESLAGKCRLQSCSDLPAVDLPQILQTVVDLGIS